MEIIFKAEKIHGKFFTYTLINSNDLVTTNNLD